MKSIMSHFPAQKILLVVLSLSSITASASPWSDLSNPENMNLNFQRKLKDLPTSAVLPKAEQPWSGPYWADKKGSIGFRWQTKKRPWQYQTLTPERAKMMTSEELALLSPAEKFDLLRSQYDFPLLTEVRAATDKHRKAWEGICVGWAQAAMHYNEPPAMMLGNTEGLIIPFGSGDLKAIASYYYAVTGEQDRNITRVGVRCDPGAEGELSCGRDVNAGALHIVLANQLGLNKKGLFADMAKGHQIWQHPIYGFESKILGERAPSKGASPMAVKEVFVKTKILYVHENRPKWDLDPNTDERKRHLNYWLELDEDGEIVGGSYVLTLGVLHGRVPDYLWTSEPLTFGHGFEVLNELLTKKGSAPIEETPAESGESPESKESVDPRL